MAIKSFRHQGVQRFFETRSKAGIQPAHAARLRRQLRHLNDARGPQDMNIPGWNFHPLSGEARRPLVGVGERELAVGVRL